MTEVSSAKAPYATRYERGPLTDASTEATSRKKAPAAPEGEPSLHPSRMTPRQRDRRDRLIDSALDLLETLEYDQVSVRDVAEHANVSLGALYKYFASKERLFAEALFRWAETLPTNIRNRPLRANAPRDRLMEAMHRAVRAFEHKPQMARLVNVLLNSPDPTAMEMMARVDRATSVAYLQALATIDPGIARRSVDVVNAVLSVSLRDWSLGRTSINVVYDRLDSAISLVIPA
jgi:AcrR family transcriptional regulator